MTASPASAMSEEIRLNLQNEIKNEPLEDINSTQSIFVKSEPTGKQVPN